LPFLFRALHSLAPSWHGFCLQLDVNDLDKIERNGTSVDDYLVLGLQGWLRGDKVSWKQLISAIFQPAGGNNKRMAQAVAGSFKEMCTFEPIEQACNASTAQICGSRSSIDSAVKDIQGLLGNKVAARWYQMGVTLGAPVSDLQGIRVRKLPPSDSEALMLRAWLKNCSSTTWQWLVDSVGHAAGGNHQRLARQLAKKKPSDMTSSGMTDQSSKAANPGPTSSCGEQSVAAAVHDTVSGPTTTTKRTGKLDINKDVLEAKTLLINLEKDELKDLFMKLGLFDATLHNKYSASVSVYANDLLRAWILGKDGVLKSEVYQGGATWENLRNALISLNHHGVAESV
jgi:hypothetical protein